MALSGYIHSLVLVVALKSHVMRLRLKSLNPRFFPDPSSFGCEFLDSCQLL